jgi:hypothetical protein
LGLPQNFSRRTALVSVVVLRLISAVFARVLDPVRLTYLTRPSFAARSRFPHHRDRRCRCTSGGRVLGLNPRRTMASSRSMLASEAQAARRYATYCRSFAKPKRTPAGYPTPARYEPCAAMQRDGHRALAKLIVPNHQRPRSAIVAHSVPTHLPAATSPMCCFSRFSASAFLGLDFGLAVTWRGRSRSRSLCVLGRKLKGLRSCLREQTSTSQIGFEEASKGAPSAPTQRTELSALDYNK